MSSRKDEIIQKLSEVNEAMTANGLANLLNLDRANVSRYLNELNKEGLVTKSDGRPVRYQLKQNNINKQPSFENLVGHNASLKTAIQKAKAAILYPPKGLHTLLFGETGTGKSLFAECMYNYAKSAGMLKSDAPFVAFNCADYAQNPQLLFAHIFGVRKGAFTGAEQDSDGLVAQADGGILFLDEIHRLPPEGQEMLFTFIDKGVYRPLGESKQTHQASVQIIGATTEQSSSFLTTFNRRIPMSIELPPLRERTLEERFEIATYFLQLEANRLNVPIMVERDVILSLMTYQVEANVGQVKRDIKLICAKSFLQYQLQNKTNAVISQQDLPLNIQKGLLLLKQQQGKITELLANLKSEIIFLPGSKPVELYPAAKNENTESFLEGDMSLQEINYFDQYVDELQEAANTRYQVNVKYQHLAQELYDLAGAKLDRTYNKRSQFAFAMHLQIMLERLQEKKEIKHPDLTAIRKHYLKEFQVAMELSQYIEEQIDFSLPMDEIGFITMFLALPEHQIKQEKKLVQVFVLMHGEQTASNMLRTAQELMQTNQGIAFDMSLQTNVLDMYQTLLEYIKQQHYQKDDEILLLTDMGSLTRFGEMISKETDIRVKTIPLVSTSVVMEALRLAEQAFSLEEIYQSLIQSMSSILEQQEVDTLQNKQKAIVVTCFTGEGVASRLNERVREIVNGEDYKIIQMQFLEHSTFRRHIDDMQKQYDIKAIVGTVSIHYHSIPYFSVIDLFDDKQIEMFKRALEDEIPIDSLIEPLEETLKQIDDIPRLLTMIRKQLHNVQHDLSLFVEPNIEAGIILHLAFLIDCLLKKEKIQPKLQKLDEFKQNNKLVFDVVTTQLLPIEQQYNVQFNDDERALITQMIIQNQLESEFVKSTLLT